MKKLIFAALGVVAVTSAWAQTLPAKPDEKTLTDAYTYLLGRALVIRQEHKDRRGDGFAFNTIRAVSQRNESSGIPESACS